MQSRTTVHVAPDADPISALRDAVRRAVQAATPAVSLVFPPDARPGREMIDALVEEAGALARGTELTLVHPSPSIGFLVSSVSLRLPHVRVLAAASVREAEGPVGPTEAELDTAPRSDPTSLAIASVTRAFEQAVRGRKAHCVIVLDPTTRPPTELIRAIELHAKRTASVTTIYLVHPLPMTGFLASTLSLRLPTHTIRAVANLAMVREE